MEVEVGWQGEQSPALVLSASRSAEQEKMSQKAPASAAWRTGLGSGHFDRHPDSGGALFWPYRPDRSALNEAGDNFATRTVRAAGTAARGIEFPGLAEV
jgi:hypothetical protein